MKSSSSFTNLHDRISSSSSNSGGGRGNNFHLFSLVHCFFLLLSFVHFQSAFFPRGSSCFDHLDCRQPVVATAVPLHHWRLVVLLESAARDSTLTPFFFLCVQEHLLQQLVFPKFFDEMLYSSLPRILFC